MKEGSFLSVPYAVWKNRRLIAKLARSDFRTRYAGSYLGIIWAFIQPVVTVFIYWFIFGFGFKSTAPTNVPFVLYLVAGIVPWFYHQEVLMAGTNVLMEYSYHVKKVVFDIRILPTVKAVSAFFVHAFFVLVALIIGLLYGYRPGIYLVQLLYYYLALFLLSIGICYATCAVVVFFRDLAQIISIILQIGIWTIPVMFDPAMFSFGERYAFLFKINPMYYIVNGYRDSIYARAWFFEHPLSTLYFWCVTAALLIFGSVIFKRLRPHFADVL